MSKPAEQFFVNGIVAVRDQMPYLQLSTENGLVVELTMAQARQVAADIVQMAARTEADAMIVKFFGKMDFPAGATSGLMQEFRDFRAELDQDEAART